MSIQITERIKFLIAGYFKKTLSPEEHDELDSWVEESDENLKCFEDEVDKFEDGISTASVLN